MEAHVGRSVSENGNGDTFYISWEKIIMKIQKEKIRYWFFEKFGTRYIDHIYEGHGNFSERRGWLWLNKIYWYDEDWR